MTVAAFALLGMLSGGLSLQLKALTPDVTVDGEVRLRVVLRADGHTELTPTLCGELGNRDAVRIRREGTGGIVVYHEGAPMIACYATFYPGRSRRGGSCSGDLVLQRGWTHPEFDEMSFDEAVAAAPARGLLTFSVKYLGLSSNSVLVRVREP